jgi:hypothetical protein
VCTVAEAVECAGTCTEGVDCAPLGYAFYTPAACESGCFPDDTHGAEDAVPLAGQLVDGAIGTLPLDADDAWVGWQAESVRLVFRFAGSRDFTTLTLGVGDPDGATRPASVAVAFAEEGAPFGEALAFDAPALPAGAGRHALVLPLGGRRGQFVELVVTQPSASTHLYLDDVSFGPPPAPEARCYDASCDPATGTCALAPRADGSACDDGDACTAGDSCHAGRCVAAPVVCAADGQCGVDARCDAASGACVVTSVNEGAACDDGDSCTFGETCAAGACVPLEQYWCGESNECMTVLGCDPDTRECLYAYADDGAPCDDHDLCSTASHCSSGWCANDDYRDCSGEFQCMAS